MDDKDIKDLNSLYKHLQKTEKKGKGLNSYLVEAKKKKQVNIPKVYTQVNEMSKLMATHLKMFSQFINSQEAKQKNRLKMAKKLNEMKVLVEKLTALKDA